jgi:hypothetical protein
MSTSTIAKRLGELERQVAQRGSWADEPRPPELRWISWISSEDLDWIAGLARAAVDHDVPLVLHGDDELRWRAIQADAEARMLRGEPDWTARRERPGYTVGGRAAKYP